MENTPWQSIQNIQITPIPCYCFVYITHSKELKLDGQPFSAIPTNSPVALFMSQNIKDFMASINRKDAHPIQMIIRRLRLTKSQIINFSNEPIYFSIYFFDQKKT